MKSIISIVIDEALRTETNIKRIHSSNGIPKSLFDSQ